MMLDQRELDLIRKIRFADGPVAAADFRRAILDSREKHQATEYEESKSATHSHDSSPYKLCVVRDDVVHPRNASRASALELRFAIQHYKLPMAIDLLQSQ